jgi:RES domain-containing protein
VITAWRIVREVFIDTAFSGKRALSFPARWHTAGRRIVYTAESVALSVLELLVQSRDRDEWPDFAIIPCRFDEQLVQRIDVADLPRDWALTPHPESLRRRGDAWLRSGRSAVLCVPSAVTRVEVNYLLNPAHPDFPSIEIGAPLPFEIDVRLTN